MPVFPPAKNFPPLRPPFPLLPLNPTPLERFHELHSSVLSSSGPSISTSSFLRGYPMNLTPLILFPLLLPTSSPHHVSLLWGTRLSADPPLSLFPIPKSCLVPTKLLDVQGCACSASFVTVPSLFRLSPRFHAQTRKYQQTPPTFFPRPSYLLSDPTLSIQPLFSPFSPYSFQPLPAPPLLVSFCEFAPTDF